MSVELSLGLAEFVKNADSSEAGVDAAELAKRVIADTVAVIMSGAGSDVAPAMLSYVSRMGAGSVPLIGTDAYASAPAAALVGGTFGAALDFDDVLSMMPGHPAAVIMPALFAQCYDEPVSGKAFIDAYIVGLEVGAKLSQGVGIRHYQRGYHTTGTIALFCAVAALARRFDLSVAQTQMAFSLAASTASGIQANFGTMTKPLHSGWAAQSAVIAVDLVRSGFTASLTALEDKGGYLAAYGTEESDASKVLPLLGKPWTIVSPGIALKKFPTCYATHRAIDGVAEIEKEVGPLLDQLKKLTCRVVPGALLPLRFNRPKTGLEGKFSMPYGLAVAMVDRRLTIASFEDTAVKRPEIWALYNKIEVIEDEACGVEDPDYNKKSAGTRGFVIVEAELHDGRTITRRVDVSPGHPKRPLTWNDLNDKFLDCASSCGVDGTIAQSAFEALKDLETKEDVSALLRPLIPSAKRTAAAE
ncbi:MmgE/PrpD family protein [Agrobacterium sp. AGB01]|uniref:MmgE/PrpD family protein n=1 Tax=Agrobacterium sp. AGB01 TaxID=2769302 RepID=UPI0017823233|nr:MmgE/PrpD family protein [Agrobacterium sp. AGB01]MBD9388491.1 MmgE/PrpD family protein [Agrobacterium sp. AGB01]